MDPMRICFCLPCAEATVVAMPILTSALEATDVEAKPLKGLAAADRQASARRLS